MDVKSEIRELNAEELDEVQGAGGLTVVRPPPPTAGLKPTVGPFSVGGSDFTTEGGGGGGGSTEYDGNKWITFEK
jgi:hypothetical protein